MIIKKKVRLPEEKCTSKQSGENIIKYHENEMKNFQNQHHVGRLTDNFDYRYVLKKNGFLLRFSQHF